jgi:Tol biopolymer transport system component
VGKLVVALALVLVTGADAAAPRLTGRIVFSAGPLEPGRSNVYLYDFGTSNVTRLTHDRGIHFDPALSPDGRRVAFRSRIGGEDYEVRVVNVDGSGLRNLTRNAAMDYAPAWSPDGKRIAFASERGFRLPHVWVMNADGSNPHVLTRAFTGEYPAWSPDGKRIVFASNITVTATCFELVVVNADGTNPRRLTRNNVYDMGPDWSPDGRRIAFYSGRDTPSGGHDVYVMRPDGNGVRRLTRGAGELPSWSPDGRHLVYAAPTGLVIIRPDGTAVIALQTGTTGSNFADWGR